MGCGRVAQLMENYGDRGDVDEGMNEKDYRLRRERR